MIAQVHVLPTPFPARPERPVPLEVVIAQHGPWPVLRAALAALLRGEGRVDAPTDAHLRRDIGLEPLPPKPPDWSRIKR